MQHAGDRPARAGPHIGGRAGDGAGDADAAEQRRADIGGALRHQLALERWRRPVMLSATTADSRLSMPPSSAKDEGGGQHLDGPCRSTAAGRCGAGSDCGMPPKRVPMVSTGSAEKRGHGGRQR